ncbi:MAG TPA: hypothetical protein VJS45_01120 [Acidimicrobiia bacterium]|nr:hypothetical protein [Acidimicrobiia bacterium]
MSAMRSRARLGVLALAVLFLVSALAAPAQAAESRGAATHDGWWNRLQGPQEGEPAGNPIRTVVPALPKPPNVPADAISAGATAGQVDKVAAVGIDVVLADGASLDRLVLRLKESEASGANVGADKAKVLACPATSPWGPGQNGNWQDRPLADCSLGSAEGARGEDGTWTFDLAAIGRLWADPFAPLPAHGVVLSVDPAASQSPVQVSWLNLETGKVGVELAATPPTGGTTDGGPYSTDPAAVVPAETAPATAPDTTADSRAFPSTGVGATGTPEFAIGTGNGADAATPAASDTAAIDTTSESPPEATLTAAPDRPAVVPGSRRAVDFWERVPTSTALLIPVALGLAFLISMTLGPAGRPSPIFRREGGLSRALARRNPHAADGA